MNHTVRGTIRRSVLHSGIQGEQAMRIAGFEAAAAINRRSGRFGVSPAMLLFGQRTKLYGEMCENGVASVVHPEVLDPASALARRLKIRMACKQALERHHARELIRRSVAARTRPVKEVEVGQRVVFYRHYSTPAAVRKQSARGSFLGPGLVIGRQNKNAWVSYAGRCYLVSLWSAFAPCRPTTTHRCAQ